MAVVLIGECIICWDIRSLPPRTLGHWRRRRIDKHILPFRWPGRFSIASSRK